MNSCLWLLAVFTTLVPASAYARSPRAPATSTEAETPRSVNTVDNTHFLDINRIKMFVTNTGSFCYDKGAGVAGLEFPRGSTRTAVFAAGLWLGGQVGGSTRIAVSEYSDEYGPGPMVGTAAAPDNVLWHVYKLNRNYTSTAERDAALAAYDAGAEPYGAPSVSVQPDGSLNILGDQMAWAVYNDANPTTHNNRAGTTTPLGVEVQQTTFAFNRSGPVGQVSAALGQTIFIRYKIINKGGNTINNMYVSQWSDPDLGGFTDDLVGCDPSIGVGFVYNATNNDGIYGSAPPSVGYDFFQGPRLPDGSRLNMTSFNRYSNTTGDPDNASKTYNYMQGLNADGTPLVNPLTNVPTTFAVSGDPVLGGGWLDSNPADRRLMLSSGPFTLAANDTQEVVTGIIIGDWTDRLGSVSLMKFYDTVAQSAFEQNFDLASPPTPPVVNSTTTDHSIVLTWDRTPENYDQLPYVFEGYVVYQSSTNCGPWKRVATFDVDDNITTVLDPAFDPESRAVLPKVSALGTNSGLRYSFEITQDYINGGPLHSGTPYYFAVTAYSVAIGQVPQALESAQPCNVAPLIPQTPAAGVDLSSARIVQPPTYSQLDTNLVIARDSVVVRVVDPTRMVSATYTIGFKPGPTGTATWYLVRMTTAGTDTVLNDQTNFAGDENFAIVDGIQVVNFGAFFRQLSDAAYIDSLPNPPGLEGLGGDLGLAFFNGSADYAFNLFGSALDPVNGDVFDNVEIRFTGDPADFPQQPVGQNAYRYLRSATTPRTYLYQDYVNVPFTAWDVDDPAHARQLNVGFVENTGTEDLRWYPDSTVAGALGNRDWFEVFKSDYSATPLPLYTTTHPDILNDAGLIDGQYVLWAKTIQDPDVPSRTIPIDPKDRFTFTISPGIRLGPTTESANDRFVFRTVGPTDFNATVAKTEIDRIRVVPNPYFAHSRYEQSQYDRVVKFTHLPPRCTIRIFNLGGDLVRTLQKDDASTSQARWDLQTDRGLPVGSGIYVFHVEAPGVGERTGKFAVFLEKERLTNF